MPWITAARGLCFLASTLGLKDAPALWFGALRGTDRGRGPAAGLPDPEQGLRRERLTWVMITLRGVANVTMAFAAVFAGTAGMAFGAAVFLANAQPLLTILPAWWLYQEPLLSRILTGIALGFAGLLLVGLTSGGGSGAWLSLLAAAACAWHFLIGGALMAAVREPAPAINWTPQFIAVLPFLSLVGTAAAFLAWFREASRSRLDLLTAGPRSCPSSASSSPCSSPKYDRRHGAVAGIRLVMVSLWLVVRPPRTRTGHGTGTKDSDAACRRGPLWSQDVRCIRGRRRQ